MFLAVLSAAYEEEKLENGEERVRCCASLLSSGSRESGRATAGEEGRPAGEGARHHRPLKFDHNCQYDEKDSIGKRYRRQDAIGTPYCITVDHEHPHRRHRDHPRPRHHAAGARCDQ
jgi:glycyl-tRNA synthetase